MTVNIAQSVDASNYITRNGYGWLLTYNGETAMFSSKKRAERELAQLLAEEPPQEETPQTEVPTGLYQVSNHLYTDIYSAVNNAQPDDTITEYIASIFDDGYAGFRSMTVEEWLMADEFRQGEQAETAKLRYEARKLLDTLFFDYEQLIEYASLLAFIKEAVINDLRATIEDFRFSLSLVAPEVSYA